MSFEFSDICAPIVLNTSFPCLAADLKVVTSDTRDFNSQAISFAQRRKPLVSLSGGTGLHVVPALFEKEAIAQPATVRGAKKSSVRKVVVIRDEDDHFGQYIPIDILLSRLASMP